MPYTPAKIEVIDAYVQKYAGEHYDALKAEFVDFNDMRIASVREMMDLGLPKESVFAILDFLREIENRMYPNLKQKGEDVPSAEQPMDAEEVA